MRKFILSSLALMVGGLSLVSAQTKKPLVEHFTQASCGPCASLNPTLYTTLNTFGAANYTKITYQVSWPGVDPMNAAYPAGPNDRRNYYSVTGVPTARLNGTDQGQGANGINSIVSASTLAAEAALTTDVGLSINHSHATGSDFNVNITVRNVSAAAIAAGRVLHTALTEKEINYASAPGSNGETDFFHVVRNMYNANTNAASTSGYTLPAIPAGDSVVINATLTAPGYVGDFNEIGFVTFVQNQSTREIYQSEYSEPVTIPNPTDVSTANAVYGSTNYCNNANWTPSFDVTNTQATAITSVEAEYTINGGTPVATTLSGVNLAQNQTGTVTFPAVTLPGGASNVVYRVVSLNGSAPDMNGTNNANMSGAVLVLGTFAQGAGVNEGFESYTAGTTSPSDAIPVNPTNKPAFVVEASSFGGSGNVGGWGQSAKSFAFDFWPNAFQSGETSIQFNRMDMSDASKSYSLRFDWSFAQYSGSNDKVDINLSSDCGATWTNVWSKAGAQLATAPDFANQQQRFVPTAAQWDSATIDLTTFLSGLTAAQKAEVIVEVKGTSNWGNPAYIDNLNVVASTATNINNIDNAVSAVKLMPNPVRENMTLEFTTTDATDATITIVNALGQNVRTVANGSYVGTTNMNINTNDLASGVYFLNIISAEGVKSTRFVVEK